MKGKEIRTAVVILNWNGKKYLEKFLPTVIKYSSFDNVEIIIADNGSSDDSVKFIKEKYPQIRLIIFDKNYGFTGGYNKALSEIESKYFVLLNSDVEVTENWLEPIISMLEHDENIGAAAPKIIAHHDKKTFEYAGAAGGFIDKYGYPFCRGRIIQTVEKDEGQFNDIKEVLWASGAAMFVRADLYKKLGGLDNVFFAHMEEIDFCWRLHNSGYKVVYNSNSVVYHVGGGALPKDSSFKVYLNYRNNLLMLLKNLPRRKLFLTLFIRLFLDGLSGLVYLATGKFSFLISVIKAHFSFYRLSVKTYKKRSSNNKKLNNIYRKSLVINYFIRNKKKFNDLNFKK